MIAALLLSCPRCVPALEAREMFAQLDLLQNLGIAVLPFAVTIVAVLAIARVGDARRDVR
jgi:hypothetical protein